MVAICDSAVRTQKIGYQEKYNHNEKKLKALVFR